MGPGAGGAGQALQPPLPPARLWGCRAGAFGNRVFVLGGGNISNSKNKGECGLISPSVGWSPVFPHSKSLPVGSFLWSSLFPVAMAYPSLPGPSALPHHWCHHPAIEVPPREGAMSHQMSLSTDTNYLLRAWCWALQGHSPRVGGHPLFPWCQQSVSPVLCPTHTPKLWQCPGSSNAVLCMHTGALSGASVQPRLATCGSRAVLVWRSLVSIKSSSRARQPRMVQAHTPSPSLPPSPLA